ncbi:armadillo repeat-containing protein [Anaeramoeba flamelloides]|uniref:Armadillo repeat-containing protein n=1 Tax=Anaeramoeba flamelloides TaxID=1746091 RepID=A0ABQ8X8Z4_9EUKA|nr:armadillo repeat-containing protein [Anaeramoeba flamelloides]
MSNCALKELKNKDLSPIKKKKILISLKNELIGNQPKKIYYFKQGLFEILLGILRQHETPTKILIETMTCLGTLFQNPIDEMIEYICSKNILEILLPYFETLNAKSSKRFVTVVLRTITLLTNIKCVSCFPFFENNNNHYNMDAKENILVLNLDHQKEQKQKQEMETEKEKEKEILEKNQVSKRKRKNPIEEEGNHKKRKDIQQIQKKKVNAIKNKSENEKVSKKEKENKIVTIKEKLIEIEIENEKEKEKRESKSKSKSKEKEKEKSKEKEKEIMERIQKNRIRFEKEKQFIIKTKKRIAKIKELLNSNFSQDYNICRLLSLLIVNISKTNQHSREIFVSIEIPESIEKILLQKTKRDQPNGYLLLALGSILKKGDKDNSRRFLIRTFQKKPNNLLNLCVENIKKDDLFSNFSATIIITLILKATPRKKKYGSIPREHLEGRILDFLISQHPFNNQKYENQKDALLFRCEKQIFIKNKNSNIKYCNCNKTQNSIEILSLLFDSSIELQNRVRELNIFQKLISTLRRYVQNSSNLNHCCCIGILNCFVQLSENIIKNREKLIDLGILSIIRDLLKNSINDIQLMMNLNKDEMKKMMIENFQKLNTKSNIENSEEMGGVKNKDKGSGERKEKNENEQNKNNLKILCCKIITYLARSQISMKNKFFEQTQLLDQLVILANSKNNDLQVAACLALGNCLLHLEKMKSYVIKETVLLPLVLKLIECARPNIRVLAVWVLKNLSCKCPFELKQYIINEIKMNFLVKLLNDAQDDVQIHVLGIFANFSMGKHLQIQKLLSVQQLCFQIKDKLLLIKVYNKNKIRSVASKVGKEKNIGKKKNKNGNEIEMESGTQSKKENENENEKGKGKEKEKENEKRGNEKEKEERKETENENEKGKETENENELIDDKQMKIEEILENPINYKLIQELLAVIVNLILFSELIRQSFMTEETLEKFEILLDYPDPIIVKNTILCLINLSRPFKNETINWENRKKILNKFSFVKKLKLLVKDPDFKIQEVSKIALRKIL